MKLLKAEDNQGHFLNGDGGFSSIDEVTKEDLLRLAELVLKEDEIEFDPFDEEVIRNEAHRILYRNIRKKLQDLRDRREEFVEQRDRLYQQAYEEYRGDLSQQADDDSGAVKPPQ